MQVLRRILSYLKPYNRQLALGYLALGLATAMQLLAPRLVAYVIDEGLVRANDRVVVLGALAIVALGLVQSSFTYVRSYFFQFLAEQVSYDMRNELYQHLQRLPFAFFDQAHTGQLMSRATEDVNSIRRFLMMSLRSLVHTVVMALVIAAILISTNWQLAILSLSVMPILCYTAVHFGRTIRPRFLAVQQQFGVMTNVLQENLSGARVVRAFAREEDESKKFDAELWELYRTQMATVRRSAFFFPLMTFISSLGIAVVLWYGGRQVVQGQLSIGQLTAFYLYLSMLAQPIRQLGWVVNSAARAQASGDRIFEVLDTVPDIKDPRQGVPLPQMSGRVEFRHVSFRYADTIEDALRDVSFVAEPGKKIALIGGTGSGKSTITALIPRFYDVNDGAVLIDDIDVRQLQLQDLRRQIGIVLQDSFLFSDSIRGNIAYGRSTVTEDQLVEAAKAARIHDFIMTLPAGYDTEVGERGVSLSGGQKQRIAIARALVMNPRILILDDATSSVDTETEYEIQQALQDVMVGRTTFVIAHRLLTLKRADQILVLDRGQIIERGDHLSLLEKQGAYARIYELQLREQEEFASAAD